MKIDLLWDAEIIMGFLTIYLSIYPTFYLTIYLSIHLFIPKELWGFLPILRGYPTFLFYIKLREKDLFNHFLGGFDLFISELNQKWFCTLIILKILLNRFLNKKYTVYNLCQACSNCNRIFLVRKTGYKGFWYLSKK